MVFIRAYKTYKKKMKKIEIFFFILNKFININMLSLDNFCKKTLI